MEKETFNLDDYKNLEEFKNLEIEPSNKKRLNLEIELPNDDTIVCEVCGHRNPKNVGMCEMCSNYFIK